MSSSIWNRVQLSEVCLNITDGSHTSPQSVENGFYMASVKDMGQYGFDFEKCRMISEEDYIKLVKNGCQPQYGDVLIGKDGARYLEDAFVFKQDEKVVLLSSIAILRPDKNIILPEFLYYFLANKSTRVDIKSNYGSGSAIPRMILKDFKRVPIYVPPIPEQQVIVNTLSCLDKKIELNNKINKNLEEVAQAIFKSWFVDFEPFQDGEFEDSELGKIPKGWKVGTLGDILEEIEAGNRPKGGVSNVQDGVPSIGAENIIGLGKYDFSKEKYVPREYYMWMKKGIVKNWDVLLYKDGAQLGRKTIFAQNYPHETCCVNSHVFILRSNELVSQPFLYFWLDQQYMTKNIINLNTNSAQPGINQTAVKQLKILIPDKGVIDKFTDIVSKLLVKLFENCKENQVLQSYLNVLLPKLISGEFRVPYKEV